MADILKTFREKNMVEAIVQSISITQLKSSKQTCPQTSLKTLHLGASLPLSATKLRPCIYAYVFSVENYSAHDAQLILQVQSFNQGRIKILWCP